MPDPVGFTRRAVVAGAAAAAACGLPAAEGGPMTTTTRFPVVYLPHGGGPWPFVDVGFGSPQQWSSLRTYLEALPGACPTPPKAILAVSAHWEERVATVMTSPKPPMFYDYYGFPPESYRITWPAPGSPELAGRVRALLTAAGLPSGESADRGFDHGTFVPLKVAWPGAEVPTVQLSLVTGLDPDLHLRIGRALAPLRDEGVLIVGSGMSFHNMRAFGNPAAYDVSAAFDAWMGETCAAVPAARDAGLTRWASAPGARACHPREEHLLPLMVVAGAAGDDAGRVPYRDKLLGVVVSAVHFG